MASSQFKYQGLHSETPETTTTNNPDPAPVGPATPTAQNNSDPAFPPNTPKATASTPGCPVLASTLPMYSEKTNDQPYPDPPSTDKNISQGSQQPTPCQAQEPPSPYPGPSTGSYTNQAYDSTQELPAATQSHAYSPQGPSVTTVDVLSNQQHHGSPTPCVRQQAPLLKNYMGLALCSTLCCFCYGIVAMVKSSQVNSLQAQGKHVEARRAAASAKSWGYAAFSCGSIVITVVFFYYLFIGIGILQHF